MQDDVQDLLNTDDLRIVKYGTFWPRFLALLIDGLILAILTPVLMFNRLDWKSIPVLIILTLVQISYKSFFEAMYGATPGKMALRLKVVNTEFNKASLTEVLLRNIFQIGSGLVTLGLQLYNFLQPSFVYATSLTTYSQYDTVRTATLIFELIILVIYIIDLIVMLTNDESRSLHDRIGATYVIKT